MVLERLLRYVSGDRCRCRELEAELQVDLESLEVDVKYALRQLTVFRDRGRAVDALERVLAGLASLKGDA